MRNYRLGLRRKHHLSVFVYESLHSNGRLVWLHNYCLERICHNILYFTVLRFVLECTSVGFQSYVSIFSFPTPLQSLLCFRVLTFHILVRIYIMWEEAWSQCAVNIRFYLGFKFCPSLLETLGFRVPAQYIRDIIMFYNDTILYYLLEPGERSRYSDCRKAKNFFFSTSSKSVVGPTKPPIQWVPASLSAGVKELITHLQLLPRSRERGSIHPFLHMPSWRSV
jgi:hypothetical protein